MCNHLPTSLTKLYICDAITWARQRQAVPLGRGVLSSLANRNGRVKIIGIALGYIISQRKGDRCSDKDLAYADHYLQARVMTGYFGLAAQLVAITVVGYEALKIIFDALGILEYLASDKQCPEPVSPDSTSAFWGLRGVRDGLKDNLGYFMK